MSARADYLWHIRDGVLVIIDRNLGNRSVTNDIENVLADIDRDLRQLADTTRLNSMRGVLKLHEYDIIYADSEGRFDGVRVDKDNRFYGFYFFGLHEDEESAVKAVQALRS